MTSGGRTGRRSGRWTASRSRPASCSGPWRRRRRRRSRRSPRRRRWPGSVAVPAQRRAVEQRLWQQHAGAGADALGERRPDGGEHHEPGDGGFCGASGAPPTTTVSPTPIPRWRAVLRPRAISPSRLGSTPLDEREADRGTSCSMPTTDIIGSPSSEASPRKPNAVHASTAGSPLNASRAAWRSRSP